MTPRDVLNIDEASTYLAIDKSQLSALARDRRIPCLEHDGGWVFSKKSIDKWRSQQTARG